MKTNEVVNEKKMKKGDNNNNEENGENYEEKNFLQIIFHIKLPSPTHTHTCSTSSTT